MIADKIANLLSGGARIVATVHSREGLRAAARLGAGAVDFLEIRLDSFAEEPGVLLEALPSLRFPLIVTARHRSEGGTCAMSSSRRMELLETFLPHAALIDVELRSVVAMDSVIRRARTGNAGLIVSHHNFHKTPPRARLRELALRAVKARADVFKVAAFTGTPKELGRLLEFAATERRVPLSVMGMGPLGKVSRLLFARTGSVLNYGFLDKAQVGGQWPAELLKVRIAEVVDSN